MLFPLPGVSFPCLASKLPLVPREPALSVLPRPWPHLLSPSRPSPPHPVFPPSQGWRPMTQAQASDRLPPRSLRGDLTSLMACNLIGHSSSHVSVSRQALSASQMPVADCPLKLSTWVSQRHLQGHVSKTHFLASRGPRPPSFWAE